MIKKKVISNGFGFRLGGMPCVHCHGVGFADSVTLSSLSATTRTGDGGSSKGCTPALDRLSPARDRTSLPRCGPGSFACLGIYSSGSSSLQGWASSAPFTNQETAQKTHGLTWSLTWPGRASSGKELPGTTHVGGARKVGREFSPSPVFASR